MSQCFVRASLQKGIMKFVMMCRGRKGINGTSRVPLIHCLAPRQDQQHVNAS